MKVTQLLSPSREYDSRVAVPKVLEVVEIDVVEGQVKCSGQEVMLTDPTGQKSPVAAEHGRQALLDIDPEFELYLPAAQGVGAVAPLPAAKVPGRAEAQSVLPSSAE